MAKEGRPVIRAGTDGERIVLRFKTSSRVLFADVLERVRAIRGARFDWDEKVWHLALTKPNCDRVLALESVATVEIAPALGAWIADRSIIERVTKLEGLMTDLLERVGEIEGEHHYA